MSRLVITKTSSSSQCTFSVGGNGMNDYDKGFLASLNIEAPSYSSTVEDEATITANTYASLGWHSIFGGHRSKWGFNNGYL